MGRERTGIDRVADRRPKWEQQWDRVGRLDREGRDRPVVIARDEIIALVVRSCLARPLRSVSSLGCLVRFPGGLTIDLPLDGLLSIFSNCCRFGLCFDLRIAGRSCGVAPLLGIHAL